LDVTFPARTLPLVRKGIPHTTRPLTEQTIYLEIKLGPFNRGALKKA